MKNLFPFTLVLGALLSISSSANALLPINKVPEPSSLGLLAVALLVVGIIGRKK
jgi:hypothetical protein